MNCANCFSTRVWPGSQYRDHTRKEAAGSGPPQSEIVKLAPLYGSFRNSLYKQQRLPASFRAQDKSGRHSVFVPTGYKEAPVKW